MFLPLISELALPMALLLHLARGKLIGGKSFGYPFSLPSGVHYMSYLLRVFIQGIRDGGSSHLTYGSVCGIRMKLGAYFPHHTGMVYHGAGAQEVLAIGLARPDSLKER
jgi:hypothetical protein